jgi:ABC-type transport system substrate-binding protein
MPAIVEQLSKVGIDAKPVIIDDAAYTTQIEFNLDGQSKWPMALQMQAMGTYADPGNFNWIFRDRSSPNGILNNGFYNNPDVEAAMNAANNEVDPAKRMPYFYKMQELVMNDMGWTFLFAPFNTFAWAKGIHGYEGWLVTSSNNLDTVWIEQAPSGTTTTAGPSPSTDMTNLAYLIVGVAVGAIVAFAVLRRRKTQKT